MIDLSTCVPDQKVRFENGKIGVIGTGRWKTNSGEVLSVKIDGIAWERNWFYLDERDCDVRVLGWKIVEILPLETPEEKPPIDISTCAVGQTIRFANGKTGEIGPARRRSGTTELRSVKVGDIIWWWFTLDGSDYQHDIPDPEWQIVEILPVETPEEEPMPTPREIDYKTHYIEIASIVSVAFPECEVCTTDMVRLLLHENRTLRLAMGLPTYEQVYDLTEEL